MEAKETATAALAARMGRDMLRALDEDECRVAYEAGGRLAAFVFEGGVAACVAPTPDGAWEAWATADGGDARYSSEGLAPLGAPCEVLGSFGEAVACAAKAAALAWEVPGMGGAETVATPAALRAEAAARVAALVEEGLDGRCLEAYRAGVRCCSCLAAGPGGARGEVVPMLEGALAQAVREEEASGDRVVYHATAESTPFGEIVDLFVVDGEESLWEEEREGLSRGEAFVHAVNLTYPECSDYGYVGFAALRGGLVRTY